MRRTFQKLIRSTGLTTKIMIPIFAVALLGVVIGTGVIQGVLEKQISRTAKQEVENLGNELYFSIRSDYRTLFFNFGRDEAAFRNASEAAQKETINDFRQLLHNRDYRVFLRTSEGILALTEETGLPNVLSDLPQRAETTLIASQNAFIYTRTFLPWDWQLILIRDKSDFLEIVEHNRTLVILNIALMLIAILILLRFVLKVTVDDPFQKIFEHLRRISRTPHTEPLALPASREIDQLSTHINEMSTAIESREQQLISERNKTRNILDSQRAIVLVTNGQKIIEANRYLFEFFDRYRDLEHFKSEHDCICDFFIPTDDPDYIYKFEDRDWLDVLLQATGSYKVRMQRKGIEHIFTITANPFQNAPGNRVVITLNDITELETYKQELETKKDDLVRQLYTDTLTGRPNRLKLIDEISANAVGTMALINVDGFKQINDFYGHEVGDRILIELGHRIQQNSMLRNYTLYKLSADEYAIYKPGDSIRDKCVEFLVNLTTYLNDQRYHIDTHDIVFSVTLGSVINATRSALMIQADIALKTAKSRKIAMLVYDESLETLQEFAANLEWVNKLKQAIDTDRIVPYFQPIRDNADGSITKYEALIRMIGSDGTPIAPFFFLDVARKSHQYLSMTEIMIDKTFAHFQDLPFTFSINLSASDVLRTEMVEMLIEKIQSYGIGRRLTIELLETEDISNYQAVGAFIAEVKTHGCSVAIDDFGAGFSNFQHIIALNIDYLKIDGSLIQNINADNNALIIVETIASFSKKLGIRTIAEFVASDAIDTTVKNLGIDYSQGYHIAKPGPKTLRK